MKTNNNLHPCNLFVSCCFLALSSTALAQGVDFQGQIRVGASNTDNVILVAEPNTEDETIFQISPSLSLDYENQRVNALVRYQFDWNKYADLDRTNEFHRYDAKLTGELVDDMFFLDVGGSRSQAVIDPDGVIPSGNLPISGNLTDRDEYSAGLRFEKALGRAVSTRANYRYAKIKFDDSSSQDNSNEDASFEIENYRNGQGFTWAVRYDWRETEYEVSLPWEHKQASAELGWWLNGNTRIFASGGQESAWDDPVDRSLEDGFWEAGFAYKNGDKIDAEFAAGERSFGSSWRGRVSLSFQRGNLSFSYAERPTTTGLNRFSGGNLLAPQEPDDLLARPGSSERYISNRGQASLGLNFRRTSLNFVVFDEDRTGRFRADGTSLGDESQQGVSAAFSWQAGARTELTASGSINSRETDSSGETDFIRASVGANYTIGSSVMLTLSYSYTEQDPVDEILGRDYVANVVSFFVSYSF